MWVKLSHLAQELFTLIVTFIVYLSSLSPIVCLLPLIYRGCLAIWLNVPPSILWFLLWTLFTSVLEKRTRSPHATILSNASLQTAISIFLRRVTGRLKKLVSSTQNVIFSCVSHISHAISTLAVGLSVCMSSMVIFSSQEVLTFTEDSVCAGIANCFGIQIVACSYDSRSDACSTVCLTFWTGFYLCPGLVPVLSLLAQSLCLCSKFPWCSGPCTWCRVKCCLLISRSPKHVYTCMVPFYDQWNSSLHLVRTLDASGRLIRHFQCWIR